MNTKQIQFNHQGVASLLLAGLILGLAAGLIWTETDASGSTVQPAKMVQQSEAYSPQPGHIGPSVDVIVIYPGADFSGGESGLLPWSQFRSIKGSKPGVSGGSCCTE
jgi:hypothetical protein